MRLAIARVVVVLLVAAAALSCGVAESPIGEADARRLDITIELASSGSTFDARQAIALANENLGFTLSPDLQIDAVLAHVAPAHQSVGGVVGLVWIVRYSGNVPASAPEPSAEGPPASPHVVRYAYVLIDPISGEILEITYTGV